MTSKAPQSPRRQTRDGATSEALNIRTNPYPTFQSSIIRDQVGEIVKKACTFVQAPFIFQITVLFLLSLLLHYTQ